MTDDAARKTVTVTSPNGDEHVFAAAEFLHLPDGSLLIGPDSDPVAVIAPGQWSAVRHSEALVGNGHGTFARCPTCGTPKAPVTP